MTIRRIEQAPVTVVRAAVAVKGLILMFTSDHIDVPTKRRELVDLSAYRTHDSVIGAWQVGSTLAASILCWALMIASSRSLLLLPLMAVAAGLLIRLLVLQHDCGHNSLFTSARANDIVGSCLGVLTCTPYLLWRHTHALHHKTPMRIGNDDTGVFLGRHPQLAAARAQRSSEIGKALGAEDDLLRRSTLVEYFRHMNAPESIKVANEQMYRAIELHVPSSASGRRLMRPRGIRRWHTRADILLRLVAQICPRWNRLTSWMRQIEDFKRAA